MNCDAEVDPRIRRTRQMLFQALVELLKEKCFDAITMQDIADRSTLNRGTIYSHFKDKFGLLEAMVGEHFQTSFSARMGGPSGQCQGALRNLILVVCEFLGSLVACGEEHQRPFEPIVESTVRAIIRDYLLYGLSHGGKTISCAEARLRATAASWAICGTVLEWSRERSTSAEELADAVLPLVAPGLLM